MAKSKKIVEETKEVVKEPVKPVKKEVKKGWIVIRMTMRDLTEKHIEDAHERAMRVAKERGFNKIELFQIATTYIGRYEFVFKAEG